MGLIKSLDYSSHGPFGALSGRCRHGGHTEPRGLGPAVNAHSRDMDSHLEGQVDLVKRGLGFRV